MLPAGCPHCGKALTPDLAFCTGCGQALRGGDPNRVVRVRGEERRLVSVLFVDAVGSTPFAENADPETVRAHQTDFFDTVRRVVRQYGGVVEKYIGDAAMVLFGAPVATESDAVRAVRAGLDVQRALSANEQGGRPGGDEQGGRPGGDGGSWSFRVGIATGEALVDLASAHDGGQAIVAGDVVNTAARLQAAAPPGGVLVCASTHAAARTQVTFVAQPAVTLRGRSVPTEVWLAQSAVLAHADEAGDDVPLVGREHELALLTSALDHAIRHREPGLVTVLGSAGIGKSRLVRELYDHGGSRARWLRGRCPPYGENTAFAALADIVKAQAGVLATDLPATARDRLEAALHDLVGEGEAARLTDALGPLVGLPGSPLSPEDTEASWRRFVLALVQRGPTVLVVEDLQWADSRMIRFVELVATTIRDAPLLIVCTARPELLDREPGFAAAAAGMLTLSLTPLRDEEVARLYSEMFGGLALPDELLRPLVERAGGMPLYAHEYGRMLVERGTLHRRAGAGWTLTPTPGLPTPSTVQAVIANRVDLLDAGERGVLQAAAVVGVRFWPGAVAAALGSSLASVELDLRALAQRDLVREQPTSSMAGEPEYRFRHALVADVCYERLPLGERVARHVRTAEWIEARGTGPDLMELVAHHRFAAYETSVTLGLDAGPFAPPALAALRRAARRATMLHAFDAASAHLARANQLLPLVADPNARSSGPRTASGAVTAAPVRAAEANRAPRVGEVDRLGLELLALELSLHSDEQAYLESGGPTRLAELATLLHRVRDHDNAARAWTLLGQTAWLRGDRDGALRNLDRAVELFDACPDTPEKAHAYAELGRLHALNHEHVPSLGAAQIAADIAERLGLVEMRANALITSAMCGYLAGAPSALARLRDALEYCRAQRLPSLRRARATVAEALLEEGDLSGAAELATPDPLTALHAGDWTAFLDAPAPPPPPPPPSAPSPARSLSLSLSPARSWVLALRGDPNAAACATQALHAARATGMWRPLWMALANGALCSALLGRASEAAGLLDELIATWRRMRTIAGGTWVAAAGHAASRVGGPTAAALREALELAPHQTEWSLAAMSLLDSDPMGAALRFQRIGSTTDRMLALALVPGPARSPALRQELAGFAHRNRVIAALWQIE